MRRSISYIIASLAVISPWFLPAQADQEAVESFFEAHCYDCHDSDGQKGGIDLFELSRDLNDPAAFSTWVKVHDVIQKGEMPPRKKPRPDTDDIKTTTEWLDRELHRTDQLRVQENGRIRLRRMTRSEFENTLKELLALDRLEVKDMLPRDSKVAGYEKIAFGLDLSLYPYRRLSASH